MSDVLTRDSLMECPRHGVRAPTFICRHLGHGSGLGFFQPNEPPDPDLPFEMAWCGDCEEILRIEGEWNDRSEAFAGILAICRGCFEEIRNRNAIKPC